MTIIDYPPKITAGYFGKLPHHSDFIKYNAGGSEILMLDNWIQLGIRSAKSKMKESWKKFYKNAPVYKFLYPFTNTNNIISGLIRPEFDKSEREYPFITFLNVPVDCFRDIGFHLLPLILSKHFDAMSDLSDRFLPVMNDELTCIDLDAEEMVDKFTSYLNIKQKEFWKSIIPDNIRAFKYNLLNMSKGVPAVKITINSYNNLIDLSVLILLITTAAKYEQSPAVFWLSKDQIYTLFMFFEPFCMQFADLLDPDTTPVFELNSSSENEPAIGSLENLFDNDSTLNDLIREIKKV